MILTFVLTTYVVLNVVAEDVTNSEKEMDDIIDMLLNNEVKEDSKFLETTMEEEIKGDPVYSNGVWKCGKCDDIDESRLVLTETYNVKTNDDEEDFNLQVGASLQNISCVLVTSVGSDLSSIRRVRGTCAGETVTLRVLDAGQYDVKIYE